MPRVHPACCSACPNRPSSACRLAAQQLGLLSLVPELQEGWARVEAAWSSPPAQAAAAAVSAVPGTPHTEEATGGSKQVDAQQEQEQEQDAAAQEEPGGQASGQGEVAELPGAAAAMAATQQPTFQEAALAAAAAIGLGGGEGAGCGAAALPLLAAVEAAPALLEGMSLDDFPRLLTWSEGLCGVTLLPLRCGHAGPSVGWGRQ